jgi:uncharacterized protein YjiK
VDVRVLRRLFAGLRVMMLLAAGFITVLAFSALAAGQDAAGSGRKGKAKGLEKSALGEPERAESGAREPSGVAFDTSSGHLFLVGDEGRLVELDGGGRVLARHVVPGDIEDVAVHPRSGLLVLLSERKGALVLFDTAKGQARGEIRLDTRALLGEEPADKNQGFEGLAFREDKGRPGGGIFYLVHQRSPAMVVSLAFDPARGKNVVGGEAVLDRFKLEGRGDLTAATWVEPLKRLVVIEDARDRLLFVRDDGRPEAEIPLPGVQQEGLCLDASGTLWVADDRAGLLRFPGALAVLRSALASREGA